uniref:Bleomycin resistance protein n=2 Tax=Acinetobacter TaxID=469 RepID=A0A060DET4_ACIJU|nr:bleomycin resistance protein [Acinetobacter calcoaceticus]AIB09131.1 bleomycin resistance protein [Acinetobacter junii]
MADHVTPNLPSRDFDVTEAFYAKLGFATSWKDRGWMILQRGGLQLEFFPYPDLDPATSSFGCCLRLDDLDAMVALVNAAGAEEKSTGCPRKSRFAGSAHPRRSMRPSRRGRTMPGWCSIQRRPVRLRRMSRAL